MRWREIGDENSGKSREIGVLCGCSGGRVREGGGDTSSFLGFGLGGFFSRGFGVPFCSAFVLRFFGCGITTDF